MLIPEHYVCLQGSRAGQLDRFLQVSTAACTLFMMADGFAQCEASPHYVDWLTARLARLHGTEKSAEAICTEITHLLGEPSPTPGKASVAVVVAERGAYHFTTLGDTRIYGLASRTRTRDHSLAERCVSDGECPADRLRFHPLRNRLIAWAGERKGAAPPVSWQAAACSPGERLLLCTDGFWSQFEDEDVFSLDSAAALQTLCDRLTAAAGPPGHHDNFTAALLRCG